MKKFDEQELRGFARQGALEIATRIVTEFPDILTELNAKAKGASRSEALTALTARRHENEPETIVRRYTKGGKRVWSKAARAAQSERMKKRWAKRKK